MLQTTSRLVLSALAVVGVAAASLVGGSAIASVTTDAQTDPTKDVVMVDPKSGEKLYLQEAAAFPYRLPEGSAWPGLPAALLEDGVRMESNVPRAMVSQYWLCEWEGTYLESIASGKPDAQALDMILAFDSLPYYKEQVIDPERGWRTLIVEPALAGDAKGIASDYAGCL